MRDDGDEETCTECNGWEDERLMWGYLNGPRLCLVGF